MECIISVERSNLSDKNFESEKMQMREDNSEPSEEVVDRLESKECKAMKQKRP